VTHDDEKRAAAEAAARLVADGMKVGLGTGTTVGHLIPALTGRDIRCVATSRRTEAAARGAGLQLDPFETLDRLDLAIDGADQVDPAGWLVKGGGAAHTREKIVAKAADRFVVIVSYDKLVESLAPPVPLELLQFGVAATLRALGHGKVRDCPPSPDGGIIADYLGPVDDPVDLAGELAATPGVIEHGLFPPELVSEILVGRGGDVERRTF
jgi:ribose 5-phosphate isomerase A